MKTQELISKLPYLAAPFCPEPFRCRRYTKLLRNKAKTTNRDFGAKRNTKKPERGLKNGCR